MDSSIAVISIVAEHPLESRTTRPKSKRWRRLLGVALFLGLLATNIIAYLHARALTRFVAADSQVQTNGIGMVLFGARMPRPLNHHTPSEEGLAFTTETIPGARGTRLEVWRIPAENSKGVVISFHGHAAAKDQLLPAAREFHAMGYEVWLVDFHGSGGSTGDSTTIGWHEAEDVASVFRQVRTNISSSPIILHGGSMGAAAILRAVAELGVTPYRLILECPFDTLSHTVANRIRNHGGPTFPMTQLLLFWGGWQNGFDAFRHNPVDYARSVRVPTLLMQGDRDETISIDESRSILKNLGTNGVFRIMRGLCHETFVRSQPNEWRAAVREILN